MVLETEWKTKAIIRNIPRRELDALADRAAERVAGSGNVAIQTRQV